MSSSSLPPSRPTLSRRRFGVALTGAMGMLSLGLLPTRSLPTARAATLTPQQQAGQRIVYSYPGLTPPNSLFQHITNGEAAGVIFFGENISSTTQIAAVIQQLRQAQQQSPVLSPLLLMTDQEGGLVRRLPGEPVLSEKQIGQSSNPPLAASQAGTRPGAKS